VQPLFCRRSLFCRQALNKGGSEADESRPRLVFELQSNLPSTSAIIDFLSKSEQQGPINTSVNT